jgi:hypothetical protein
MPRSAVMQCVLFGLALISLSIVPATAAEQDLYGTYKLIKTSFKLVESGQEETISNEHGFITYTPQGRMFVIITRGERSKPENLATMTDQQRADLFRSVTAYSGMFKFDGETIEHDIDISWNEAWTGTKQIRHAKRDGDRITLTTPAQPRPQDGKLAVVTLVWEKLK